MAFELILKGRGRGRVSGFDDLVEGHKFSVMQTGSFPDEMGKCAFCGSDIKHYAKLKREDGLEIKVGYGCLLRDMRRVTFERKKIFCGGRRK